MRNVYLLFMVMFLCSFGVFLALFHETSGSLSIDVVRSVYKADPSLLFFLDSESSFYHNYPLFDNSSPVLQARKIGHFVAYGTLAAIIFLFLPYEKILSRGFLSFWASSFVGIIDEYHQHFLIGRSGRLLDIYINNWKLYGGHGANGLMGNV